MFLVRVEHKGMPFKDPIKRKESDRKRYEANKEMVKARSKQWRIDNADQYKETERAYGVENREKLSKKYLEWSRRNPYQIKLNSIKYHYGITKCEYEKLIQATGPMCPLCNVAFDENVKGSKRCVEHCHSTGRVRGICCSRCNTALGYVKDNPTTLRRMLQWLEGIPH